MISQDVLAPAVPSGTVWSFPGGELRFAPPPSGNQSFWEVSVYAPSVPLQAVHLRWRQPITLDTRFLGDHWERAYGDLEWRGIVPDRVMPWYFLASNGKDTYACGVQTGAGALCFWQSDQQGFRLVLDVRCGGQNVILGERVLSAARLVERFSQPGENPFAAACAFTHLLCPNPLLTREPVYGANDYYYAYCANTHEGLVRDSATISELSPNSTNRPYSVVDAGWQWGGLAYGAPWQLGNERFPDMPKLAREIKAAGARPGIWFRPLLTTEAVPEHWVLPESRFNIPREFGFYLDPSLPEVLERVSQNVVRFKEWGYELIKHDYTTFDLLGRWGMHMGAAVTDPSWRFADHRLTTAEVIRNLYTRIHEAAGGMVIIACNTIGHLAAGQAHLQRIGDDTSGKEWARTLKMGVNALAFRLPQHNALFAIDADCVGITEMVPWELNSQWLDLLSRSGTPLFVSLDPASLDAEKKATLREALERAAAPLPIAEPLDWMQTTHPAHWRFGNETRLYQWFRD